MKNDNPSSTPQHWHIDGIFARRFDENIGRYILVPMTDDELMAYAQSLSQKALSRETSIFQRIPKLLFGNGDPSNPAGRHL